MMYHLKFGFVGGAVPSAAAPASPPGGMFAASVVCVLFCSSAICFFDFHPALGAGYFQHPCSSCFCSSCSAALDLLLLIFCVLRTSLGTRYWVLGTNYAVFAHFSRLSMANPSTRSTP